LHPEGRLTIVLLFFHLLRPSQLLGLVQTAVEEHETKGLDTEALVLVPMVLGKVPDAKESDAELQAWCHD
jgi:hypothetical protein